MVSEMDEDLWIRTPACEERDYLVGNSHTFPGRMAGYCPMRGIGFSVSLDEIEEMSPEAARWIEGFLAGNEPDPDEMFGPGIHDADQSDPRWQRWRHAVAEFRSTGRWRPTRWGHMIPFPMGMTLPPFVWALRGDEIWTWREGLWRRANPQPEHHDGGLKGTVCFERGDCELSALTTVHLVYEDCGSTTHVVPDGYTFEEWERAQYEYVARPLTEP